MDEFRDEEKDPFEAIDDEEEADDEMASSGMHVAGEEGADEPDELDEEEDSEFLSSEEER